MCDEFCITCKIEISTDSSAAKGIMTRRGCGKVKHIQAKQLWIQEHAINGDVTVFKILVMIILETREIATQTRQITIAPTGLKTSDHNRNANNIVVAEVIFEIMIVMIITRTIVILHTIMMLCQVNLSCKT